MNLYLVRNPDGHAVWVAYENAEGQFYSYVQNTGQFHFNGGLYEDFYYDQRMTFEPVTAAAATRQSARAPVGWTQAPGHTTSRATKPTSTGSRSTRSSAIGPPPRSRRRNSRPSLAPARSLRRRRAVAYLEELSAGQEAARARRRHRHHQGEDPRAA